MINPIWILVLMSRLWPQVGAVALPPGPPEARVLIVAGDRAGIEAVRRLLSRPPCCEKGRPRVPVQPVYLEHADARALARVLEPGLSTLVGLGPVRIVADVPTNSLIVEASEADFASVAPLVAALDKPPFPSKEFALPRILVDSVAAASGGGGDGWAAYCHVVEGWRCFPVPAERIDSYDGQYDAALEARALPVGLSRLVILVIDPRHIEHARGNGVKLRYRRGDRGQWVRCGVDWGWGEGWEAVGVWGG